ncbi:hypothetical protein J6590_056532 [Homalodisca vitripennis]|nr:hypothetical protein J6590_056532 [Homalodisca vitripennis]
MPPTGSTLPLRETSPVMATFWRIGVLSARDSKAVTIVHPALGPSLGVAPCSNTTNQEGQEAYKLHLVLYEPLRSDRIFRTCKVRD